MLMYGNVHVADHTVASYVIFVVARELSCDAVVSWFINYPRRGVSVRESPALLISRKQHSEIGRRIKYS